MIGVMRLGSYLFPQKAADISLGLFLSPKKYDPPIHEREWKKSAELFRIADKIQAYRWGENNKPKVLLVHGWSGRGTQMGAFVNPLIDKGYQVLSIDGPAHGDSQGTQTNAGEFSRWLSEVSQELGPFEAVIAHSFGAGCATLASTIGLESKSLVLISCPADYGKIINNYLAYMNFSDRSNRIFLEKLIHLAKLDPKNLHIGKIGSTLNTKTLIIHDESDKEVPVAAADEIKHHWPTADVLKTKGLGHRRILKSQEVIEQVAKFISTA